MYFSLVGNYLRPFDIYRPLNFNLNAVVLIVITCFKIYENGKMLSIFTVFLKNKNIIFKIRRSKVTDYAALNAIISFIVTFTPFPRRQQFVPFKQL